MRKIYIVYPTHCPMTRQGILIDDVAEKYHHETAREAWLCWANVLWSPARKPDPADYLVVSGELTGEMNARGVHLVRIDWATAVPAVVVMQEPPT